MDSMAWLVIFLKKYTSVLGIPLHRWIGHICTLLVQLEGLGCLKLLDQGKQTKFQNPSEIPGDNLNIVRHEVSRHFRNKKRRMRMVICLQIPTPFQIGGKTASVIECAQHQ
jgi:hypothetical protein